jgi:hypothetical protein
MIKEDKELLLKDLCSRLPYNCRVFYEYVDNLDGKTYGYSLILNTWCINELIAEKAIVKPYLRPMSSMTEEERQEYEATCCDWYETLETYDWLNAHHFDYRGLIEKGLALEAPKDMYKA